MVKKLISKAELSRRTGVSKAAITKACNGFLKDAMEGKRVNVSHPDVVEYLENHREKSTAVAPPPPPATGIDSLYESAVQHCKSNNRYTVSNVARGLSIGFKRAGTILATMTAAGIIPAPGESVPPPPPEDKPETVKPVLRGTAAKNAKAKKAPTPAPVDAEEMLLEIPEDIRAFAEMSLRELVTRFGTDTRFCDWLKATKSIEDINEKRLKNAVSRGELVSRDLMKVGVIEPIDAAHRKLLTDGAKTIARRLTAMHDAGRSLEDCEEFVIDQISSFIRPVKSKVARALRNA